MKKYLITIMVLFASVLCFAQKKADVNTNTLYPPKTPLKGIHKIYVEPFVSTNSETTNAEIPMLIRQYIELLLFTNNNEAEHTINSQYNHTDWYYFVNSPDEADAVISGTYNLKTNKVRESSDIVKKDTVEYLMRSRYYEKAPVSENFSRKVGNTQIVPVIERTYNYSNKIEATYTYKITDKSGAVLVEDTIQNIKEYVIPERQGVPGTFPQNTTIEALQDASVLSFVVNFYQFIPTLESGIITLKDVKPTDKELKKAVRKLDFNTTEQLLNAAKVYADIYEKEKNIDAACNVATLYYLTGYFIDAEEWIEKSGSQENLKKTIQYERNLREEQGIPLIGKRVIYN